MNIFDRNHRIIVILFFTILLCTGLFIYKDYGIPGDEIVSRNNGMVAYKYVFEGNKEIFTYRDRFYGTAFELPLVIIEKVLGLEDPRQISHARHLATFLLFYIGVIFFYLLCMHHFKSWKMGLLGALFLVLSPRIFAHSFFNSKDAAFLSLYIIVIYTLIRYLERKTLTRALFHAVACALLVDVRIIGVFVPALTALFFVGDMFLLNEKRKMEAVSTFFVFVWSFIIFTIFFWPFLWSRPIQNFISAILYMKSYPWEGTVLYLGEYVKAIDILWHYVPVWIFVTTPVIYMFFFLAGSFTILGKFFASPLQFYRTKKNDLVFILTFFVPLVLIILSGAVLYDGWRHMFFVYAPLVVISLAGIRTVLGALSKTFRALVVIIIATSLLWTAYFMVAWHPYQNVYFNMISGGMDSVRKNFEMDYWGLTHTEALEYVLENDNSESINVYVALFPGRIGHIPAFLLKTQERKRLNFVNTPAEADYFISNYRWHRQDYSYENEVFNVDVNGAKILVVYKLK